MESPEILVLDDGNDLQDQVERAVRTVHPVPHVTRRGVDEVDRGTERGRPADVVIAGPSFASTAGLLLLRRVRLRFPGSTLILAFDRRTAIRLREAIRTGAADVLRLPVDDQVVADVITQALAERRREAANGGPGGGAGRDRNGKVIAVLSATGGSGKTFLAANLAYYLQTRLHKRTVLIDLDLQFGELSTALRLKSRGTVSDLLAGAGSDDGDLGIRLEEHLLVHDTGIAVLPAPDSPAEADAVEPADVPRLIAAAKERFDYVIVDTPATLSEAVLAALDVAEHFYAVATLDLPSVRNLSVLLTTLRRLNVPSEHLHLMLNKVEPDVGIDLAQVTRYFPQGFAIVVPYGREANRALNMGTPILAFAPRSDISRALSQGFAATLPVGDVPAVTPVPRTRMLAWRRARPA